MALPRRFYRRDPVTLAKALLGCRLVRANGRQPQLVGRIVEVEAYLGVEDKAAHTVGGRHTARNHSMYLDAGHAYVYFTYGMHHCLNVVSDREDVPTACLIRALEPIEGIETMRQNRAGKVPVERLRDHDLCSGPAKLCQALRIDRELDGYDLTIGRALWLEAGDPPNLTAIQASPRVGVGYAEEWAQHPLRFTVRDSRHVSVRP